MTTDIERCVEACRRCHAACVQMGRHCLQKGKPHNRPDHVGALLDCADLCATTENFLLRDSALHPMVCGVCADVCARCAEECLRRSVDRQTEQLIHACFDCADACRHVAGAYVH